MAKLVLLSAAFAGRTHELTVDKTTVGRVEDNTFHIADQSVSSHHCEIFLRGSDVVVKDLNSTNGTFINGEKVTETVLKPGQTLRLGQIELKLDDGSAGSASAPAAPTTPAASSPAPAKKSVDQTMVMTRGVKLDEIDSGSRQVGFDTAGKGFSKKDNKANKIIWIVAGVFGLVIVCLILYALSQTK